MEKMHTDDALNSEFICYNLPSILKRIQILEILTSKHVRIVQVRLSIITYSSDVTELSYCYLQCAAHYMNSSNIRLACCPWGALHTNGSPLSVRFIRSAS